MGASAATPDSNKSATIPGNTDKTKTEGDDNKKLSPEEVDLAVAELRYETAYYLEAIQAMMDGVTLGSEQVQNKRIEFLEIGPTVTTEQCLLTIAMVLILEGTVGPAIAARATRAVIAPLMKATSRAILKMQNVPDRWKKINRLYNEAWSKYEMSIKRGVPLSENQRGDLIWQARELRSQAALLQQDLRGKLQASRPARDALDKITLFVEENLNAVFKVPGAVSGMPGSTDPLSAQESPAVEVVAAAMASSSRLRLTFVATHEALETEIKHPNTTVGQVIALLNEYRVEGGVDLSAIRANFQLAAEAMIWAGLLVDSSLMEAAKLRSTPLAPGDRGVPYGGASLLTLNTDAKLVMYLKTRFGKEVERWALENNIMLLPELKRAENPYSVPPRPTGWWEGLQEWNREDLLTQYLCSVVVGTSPAKLNLR